MVQCTNSVVFPLERIWNQYDPFFPYAGLKNFAVPFSSPAITSLCEIWKLYWFRILSTSPQFSPHFNKVNDFPCTPHFTRTRYGSLTTGSWLSPKGSHSQCSCHLQTCFPGSQCSDPDWSLQLYPDYLAGFGAASKKNGRGRMGKNWKGIRKRREGEQVGKGRKDGNNRVEGKERLNSVHTRWQKWHNQRAKVIHQR